MNAWDILSVMGELPQRMLLEAAPDLPDAAKRMPSPTHKRRRVSLAWMLGTASLIPCLILVVVFARFLMRAMRPPDIENPSQTEITTESITTTAAVSQIPIGDTTAPSSGSSSAGATTLLPPDGNTTVVTTFTVDATTTPARTTDVVTTSTRETETSHGTHSVTVLDTSSEGSGNTTTLRTTTTRITSTTAPHTSTTPPHSFTSTTPSEETTTTECTETEQGGTTSESETEMFYDTTIVVSMPLPEETTQWEIE